MPARTPERTLEDALADFIHPGSNQIRVISSMRGEAVMVNGEPVRDWLEKGKPIPPTPPVLSEYACCLDCDYPEYYESREWEAYIQAMIKYQGEFQPKPKLWFHGNGKPTYRRWSKG